MQSLPRQEITSFVAPPPAYKDEFENIAPLRPLKLPTTISLSFYTFLHILQIPLRKKKIYGLLALITLLVDYLHLTNFGRKG